MADTVGAGSEEFGKDGRKGNGSWRDGAKGLRDRTQPSLRECLGGAAGESQESEVQVENEATPGDAVDDLDGVEELKRAIAASLRDAGKDATPPQELDDDLERAIAASMADHTTTSLTHFEAEEDISTIPPSNQADYNSTSQPATQGENVTECEDEGEDPSNPPKQIFHNLVFYINGSTAPLISDHKLKYLISSHGGSLTISHARKQVTHVIVGTTHSHRNSNAVIGAGGSLAGTKIQKEIARRRTAGGKGVRFVGAQWVIDSVRKGRRMGEAGYENVKLGGAGQGSVFEKFRVAKPGGGPPDGVKESKNDGMADEELGIA